MSFNNVFAKTWQTTNFQFLHGDGYILGDEERNILTLEHYDLWKFGENYFFFDVTNPDKSDTSIYGEFWPSLNLGKILEKDVSNSFIQDYRLVGNFEFSQDYRANLYGLGLNLKVPSFTYLQVNFMLRDNPTLEGQTHQITLAWLLPFNIESHKFQFTGFSDFAGKEDTSYAYDLTQAQLLWDISKYWGEPDGFLGGIEYSYWNNKFGIKGETESVVQFMLKCIVM